MMRFRVLDPTQARIAAEQVPSYFRECVSLVATDPACLPVFGSISLEVYKRIVVERGLPVPFFAVHDLVALLTRSSRIEPPTPREVLPGLRRYIEALGYVCSVPGWSRKQRLACGELRLDSSGQHRISAHPSRWDGVDAQGLQALLYVLVAHELEHLAKGGGPAQISPTGVRGLTPDSLVAAWSALPLGPPNGGDVTDQADAYARRLRSISRAPGGPRNARDAVLYGWLGDVRTGAGVGMQTPHTDGGLLECIARCERARPNVRLGLDYAPLAFYRRFHELPLDDDSPEKQKLERLRRQQVELTQRRQALNRIDGIDGICLEGSLDAILPIEIADLPLPDMGGIRLSDVKIVDNVYRRFKHQDQRERDDEVLLAFLIDARSFGPTERGVFGLRTPGLMTALGLCFIHDAAALLGPIPGLKLNIALGVVRGDGGGPAATWRIASWPELAPGFLTDGFHFEVLEHSGFAADIAGALVEEAWRRPWLAASAHSGDEDVDTAVEALAKMLRPDDGPGEGLASDEAESPDPEDCAEAEPAVRTLRDRRFAAAHLSVLGSVDPAELGETLHEAAGDLLDRSRREALLVRVTGARAVAYILRPGRDTEARPAEEAANVSLEDPHGVYEVRRAALSQHIDVCTRLRR